MNINLYIVISHDRHRDDIYTLFKTEEKAVEFAKKEFRAITKHKKIYKQERISDDEDIEYKKYASWLDGDYSVKVCKTNYPI